MAITRDASAVAFKSVNVHIAVRACQQSTGPNHRCHVLSHRGSGVWPSDLISSTRVAGWSWEACRDVPTLQHRCPMSSDQKARVAEQRVRVCEVSRARQCLTGAALAPGSEATFQEMQHRRPQVPAQLWPQEVLDFEPDVPIRLGWRG